MNTELNKIAVSDLPHLIRLLDDDTPLVRDAVFAKLFAFGIHLEEEIILQGIELSFEQRNILDQYVLPMLREKTSKSIVQYTQFLPGDIVHHKRYDYRGVVVDCDTNFAATNDWYNKNKTQPDKNQTWYHVLVHNTGSVTYAAQSSLEADPSKTQVTHPLIPFFFNGYIAGNYLRNSRKWGSF